MRDKSCVRIYFLMLSDLDHSIGNPQGGLVYEAQFFHSGRRWEGIVGQDEFAVARCHYVESRSAD